MSVHVPDAAPAPTTNSPERVLDGFTVGITADRRWDEQAALFERRGATVVHGPTIRTLALAEDGPLRAATEELIAQPPHALVANTGLGIRSWLVAAESWGLDAELVQSLRATRIYARGPKASGALHQAGLDVAGKAPTERLAEAVDLTLAECTPGDRVALQVDGSGDTPEIDRLRAAGLDVVVVPVYAWKLPVDRQPAIRLAEGVIAGRVHAVTFTAGPAVRNWFAMAAEEGIDGELRAALTDGRAVVGCVGPVCRESLIIEGLESPEVVQPHVARIGPLVRAVAERLATRSVRAGTGDGEIVVAGTVATVGGRRVSLSETEARLLSVLASRPNVVMTKTHLLREVWGSTTEDPHAVEVAVGRLRRRLGAQGVAVASVHRRGYMLRV